MFFSRWTMHGIRYQMGSDIHYERYEQDCCEQRQQCRVHTISISTLILPKILALANRPERTVLTVGRDCQPLFAVLMPRDLSIFQAAS
jgi:hypothetical protein